MSNVLMASAYELGKERPALLDAVFGLRYKVFFQRLGWEVGVANGRERDDFDALNPVYMVAQREGRGLEGCWRLLPTMGPYMLKDTFPELLRGEAAPKAADIWELSRFAVAPNDSSEEVAQAPIHPVTLAMIQQVYEFAVANGIKQYVTVTSVALERLLKRLNIPMIRFGDQKAQRVGRVLSVACRVPVNDQFKNAVYGASAGTDELKVAA